MDACDQTKSRLALEDVIGETVALMPAGRGRFKGLCPFHSEKTPSFTVNTERGFFYCFGCGAKGDVFAFVQQSRGLNFPEALELLAARAGVELPEKHAGKRPSKDLYDALAAAQEFFTLRYRQNPHAGEYLRLRGLTDETVTAWGLGFAPEAWTDLRDTLNMQGYSAELLERAGLVKNNNGKSYDVFRNRVTIPIHDPYGRVVGFSGRSLEQDPQAKYLNTPETEVFKKGELLFGYNHAREAVKKANAAIIVEGHLDVIMLHQYGFNAAVGVQGAALTQGQIGLLERLNCHALYMALDGDEVGQKATLAACEAVARRFVVKVAVMPDGCKDPTDVLTSDGEAHFRAILKRAVSEVDYRLERAERGLDLMTRAGHKQFLERLRPQLRGVDPADIVAAEMTARVSAKTGIPVVELRAYAGEARSTVPVTPAVMQHEVHDQRRTLQRSLAVMLLLEPESGPAWRQLLEQRLPADSAIVEFCAHFAACDYNVTSMLNQHCDLDDDLVNHAFAAVVRGGKVPRGKFQRDLEWLARLLPKNAETTSNTALSKPLGYEALREHLLKREHSPERELLLESFGYADDGDEQAIAALAGYLRKPEVQAMIGAAV